jgi:hypothetical protein
MFRLLPKEQRASRWSCGAQRFIEAKNSSLDLVFFILSSRLAVTLGACYLQVETGAMNSQPLLALSIFRQHFVDLIPERLGMVLMVEVAKFMNNDVVDD